MTACGFSPAAAGSTEINEANSRRYRRMGFTEGLYATPPTHSFRPYGPLPSYQPLQAHSSGAEGASGVAAPSGTGAPPASAASFSAFSLALSFNLVRLAGGSSTQAAASIIAAASSVDSSFIAASRSIWPADSSPSTSMASTAASLSSGSGLSKYGRMIGSDTGSYVTAASSIFSRIASFAAACASSSSNSDAPASASREPSTALRGSETGGRFGRWRSADTTAGAPSDCSESTWGVSGRIFQMTRTAATKSNAAPSRVLGLRVTALEKGKGHQHEMLMAQIEY